MKRLSSLHYAAAAAPIMCSVSYGARWLASNDLSFDTPSHNATLWFFWLWYFFDNTLLHATNGAWFHSQGNSYIVVTVIVSQARPRWTFAENEQSQ